MRRSLRPLAGKLSLAAAATAVVLGTAGCGGGDDRSPEAYCKAFYTAAAPIRQPFVDANEKGIEDGTDAAMMFIRLLQVQSDMATIFDKMARHAPDDIRSDTEAARDAFQKSSDTQVDHIENPVVGALKGLVGGVQSAGPLMRVEKYMNANCPSPAQAQEKGWIDHT